MRRRLHPLLFNSASHIFGKLFVVVAVDLMLCATEFENNALGLWLWKWLEKKVKVSKLANFGLRKKGLS